MFQPRSQWRYSWLPRLRAGVGGRPRWPLIAFAVVVLVGAATYGLLAVGATAEASSIEVLDALVEDDASDIEEVTEGMWVPQLSSQRVDRGVDARTDADRVLADHQRKRTAYPQARLLWTGGFATFKERDRYVTVVPESFSDPADANRWCDVQGFAGNSCYAVRVGQEAYNVNVAYRAAK